MKKMNEICGSLRGEGFDTGIPAVFYSFFGL
jgi:organic radical activating enzyme